MHPGAVLHLLGNVIWEWGVLSMLTPWTDLDVRAVLGHLQAARPLLRVRSGQEVMDLPRHLIMNIDAVSGLAIRTVPSQQEGEDFVCMPRYLQCLANMTTLSARRPTGLLALSVVRACPDWVVDRRSGCPKPTGLPARAAVRAPQPTGLPGVCSWGRHPR